MKGTRELCVWGACVCQIVVAVGCVQKVWRKPEVLIRVTDGEGELRVEWKFCNRSGAAVFVVREFSTGPGEVMDLPIPMVGGCGGLVLVHGRFRESLLRHMHPVRQVVAARYLAVRPGGVVKGMKRIRKPYNLDMFSWPASPYVYPNVVEDVVGVDQRLYYILRELTYLRVVVEYWSQCPDQWPEEVEAERDRVVGEAEGRSLIDPWALVFNEPSDPYAEMAASEKVEVEIPLRRPLVMVQFSE